MFSNRIIASQFVRYPVAFRAGEIYAFTLASDQHGPAHPFPHLEIARSFASGEGLRHPELAIPESLVLMDSTTYDRIEREARAEWFREREELRYAMLTVGQFRRGAIGPAGTEGKSRFWSARAMAYLMERLFQEFIPLDIESIAEAGCGPSHLFKRMIPEEYKKKRYVGFDINPHLVGEARKADQSAEIRHGSIYQPPLDDHSIDLYATLSSFDTPFYLGKAFEQVRRVLRPRRYFLCVQDVHPNPFNVFGYGIEHPMEKRRFHFPGRIDLKDMEEFLVKVVGQPVQDKTLFEVDGERLTVWDEFQARIIGSLHHTGFTLVAHGLARATFVGPRQDCHPEDRDQNHFVDYMGSQIPAHNPLLKDALIARPVQSLLTIPLGVAQRALSGSTVDIMRRLGTDLVVEEKYVYFVVAQSPV